MCIRDSQRALCHQSMSDFLPYFIFHSKGDLVKMPCPVLSNFSSSAEGTHLTPILFSFNSCYQKFYYNEMRSLHLIIEMHLKIKIIKVPTVPDIEHLKKLALIGAVSKTIKVSSSEFQKHPWARSTPVARELEQLEEELL